MMKNKDFCVFILTHGRADNVVTVKSLKRCGYTGKVYFVCDDEDKQLDKYIQNFGKENVLIFSKDEVKKNVDVCDNFNKKGVILYARNVCFDLAEKLGIRYFLELDDDYTEWQYRYVDGEKLKHKKIKDLDGIFDLMLNFLNVSNADSVALAQGGDYVGGAGGCITDGLKRKAMNTFFCDTKKKFKFMGTLNEDVNIYTYLGSQGKLFLTVLDLAINQLQTQSNAGGITEMYLDVGTYIKSFYSVMIMPSAVKIGMMGNCNMRIHHKIKWNNCVPKIINEKHKVR